MTVNDGSKALHFIAENGNYELVIFFIDNGNNILLKTSDGLNCLHIAASDGHLDLCKTLINKHNFDVNITNNEGWTVLHYSARSGSFELTKLFIDTETDISLTIKDGSNCLHTVAVKGNSNLIETLVNKYKFDVNAANNEGCTALHCSAQNGSYELINFFIKNGVDVLLKTKNRMNCLHIAASNGHFILCKTLTDICNFDMNMDDNKGWTELHHSARSGNCELIKFFIDTGTDISLKTKEKRNYLHTAAAKEDFTLIETLIISTYNFDVNVTDNEGWTPLHYSVDGGSYELIKFFIDKGANFSLKTKDGFNCYHIAALNGHLNLCNALIYRHKLDVKMATEPGWTALHISVKTGSYELMKIFTDEGNDSQLKTKDGANCLHIAAGNGHLSLCKLRTRKHNFYMSMSDNERMTAVHHSAKNGSYELIKFFIDKGTGIRLKTKFGSNSLHIAALQGNLNLCKILTTQHEFYVNVVESNGWTVLHKLIKFFIDKGADILLRTKNGLNCLHIAALHGYLSLCKILVDKHIFDVNMADNIEWKVLHFTARNGSYELIKFFTNKGADILLKTKKGSNCLHIAADKEHLNLCKTLISEHNFDLDITDNDGWKVLHYSTRSGSFELIKSFIDRGTIISLKTKKGRNCLHIEATKGDFNLSEILIEKYKFDVNVTDNEGWTSLHFSVLRDSYELVKFFIDKGANFLLKTKDGLNCLHIATKSGLLNLGKALTNKSDFDIDMADNNGWMALHFSASISSYQLIKLNGGDISLKTKQGRNCLQMAAATGHLNLRSIFTDRYKLNVNMTDAFGWTGIHHAVANVSHGLVEFFIDSETDILCRAKDRSNCLRIASFKGHLNLCNTLVDKYKFDLDIANNDGYAPLHCCALTGNYELIKFFIDKGTDISLKTKEGSNCLHIAALHGHFDLCKTLINRHNFDVHMTTESGWTALHCSAEYGSYELLKLFIDKGTDVLLKTDSGLNCLHIAARNGHLNLCETLISKHKFDVELTCEKGWTALHSAAENGSYELLKYFMDKVTNVLLQTKDGWNCLHIAAFNGHLNLCKTLINNYKFHVHVTNYSGLTALHVSVINGGFELVKFFIDMGSDIHLKSYDGANCLHIAAFYGHMNLCKMFVEKYNFDVHQVTDDKRTALHLASENGNFSLFLYLLEKGSAIYHKARHMDNALHISAYYGHFDICDFVLKYFTKDYEYNNTRRQYELNSNSYKSQIFYKYNVIFLHAMNVDGNTYLHLAAAGNQPKVCELLLKHDLGFITLLNKSDETARDIAKKYDHKDVLQVLKAHFDRIGMFF